MVSTSYAARNNLPEVPVIGDDIAQIGQALDLIANCAGAETELWAFAAWKAVPTFVIALLKPEIFDVSIGGRRHRGKKGRRLRFKADAIFRGALQERVAPRWAIAVLGEWAQRVGWYLLVLDATSDFAINWTSMVYQWNGCGLVPLSPLSVATREDLGQFTIGLNAWVNYRQSVIEERFEVTYDAVTGVYTTQADCIPRWHIEFVPKPFGSTQGAKLIGLRVQRADQLEPSFELNPEDNNADGSGVNDSSFPGEIMPAGTQYALQYFATDLMGLERMRFAMYSSNIFPEINPIAPDP